MPTTYTPGALRDEHMLILEKAFFENLMRDNCEYGGIGLDDKRPFGNSFAEGDILELIGAKPPCEHEEFSREQIDYANALYDNLIPWLQKRYRGWAASPGLLEALKEAVELLKRSYERTTSVSLGEVEPAIKRAEKAIAQAQEGKP